MARESLKIKAEKSRELLTLIEKYRTVAVVDASRLKTPLINQVRDLFRGEITFKYVKNSTLLFSARTSNNGRLMEFVEKQAHGTILLVLSNKDPYNIQQDFIKNYVELPAKAGDVLDSDLVVNAGNTGLAPGPIISELNAVGIPTRIESGSVWITKDTVVAKRGDKISPNLASVLSKLNIKPIKNYLRIRAAFVDGVTIPGELLQTPLEEIVRQLVDAFRTSSSLSIALKYLTRESVAPLMVEANSVALALACAVSFPTSEALQLILLKAQFDAATLESRIE
jgi:large subunit ribosomal protein L10